MAFGHDGDASRGRRLWHFRGSLAKRIILLTAVAAGLAVMLVSVGAYFTVRMKLENSLDNSLVHRARAAARQPNILATLSTDYHVSPALLGAADVRIGFVFADGHTQFLDTGPYLRLGNPQFAVARNQTSESLRTVRAGGTDYRVVTVPTSQQGVALVVAQSLQPQEQLLHSLGLVTLSFGLAGILAAGLAGWAVANGGLRPVRRLTTAVERVTATEDLTPLPVEGHDETARLAKAFNELLTSLATSRDRQRQLVADASHELRTPLTSLRTNIELLTQAFTSDLDLSDSVRAELLEDVRAQLDEMGSLIGDLVQLAREDQVAAPLAVVDLAHVLDAAVARVRRRGFAAAMHIEVHSEPWYVYGDSTQLERAICNLLDNAIKWSPVGGVVHATLYGGALVVDDEGTGIAEEDLPHVFERFYRSTESRGMPGSGLGLSIVSQAADRHGGTVSAARSPLGGARMTLQLPGTSLPEPDGPRPATSETARYPAGSPPGTSA